jgi:hypothetical protein
MHRVGPQATPASPLARQTSPVPQSTPQPVGSQAPSTHFSPASHVTVAQEPTHRGSAASVAPGLQTSSAAQGFGSQGSSTQPLPPQTLPFGQPKKRQLFSSWHWPWNEPAFSTHRSPVPQSIPKQGLWQPA